MGKSNKNQETGFVVAVRVDDEGDKYILKDIGLMSGEEFLLWFITIYPPLNLSEHDPADFESNENKVRALDMAVRFHQSNIFSRG